MEEEISGFTHIDTMYELKGLELAQGFYDLLFPLVTAVILALGVVRALYVASQEHRFRDLVFYIVYALFMVWLITPVHVQVAVPAGEALQDDFRDLGITFDHLNPKDGESQRGARVTTKVPRILAWTHLLVDGFQALMVDKVNSTFRKRPYASSRIALALRTAKIHDEGLRDRYYAFVLSCYLPVLANRRMNDTPAPDRYYNPFALAPDGSVSYPEYRAYVAYDAKGLPVTSLPDLEYDKTTAYQDYQNVKKQIVKGATKALNFVGNTARRFLGKSQPAEAKAQPSPLSCEQVAAHLHSELLQHLRKDAQHLKLSEEMDAVLNDLGKKNDDTRGNWSSRLSEIVLEYVLFNETTGLLAMGEIRNLQAAIPEYGVFKTSQHTESAGKWPNPLSADLKELTTYINPIDWFQRGKDAVSFIVKAKQSVDQWIQHRAEAPAMYFKITCYAPTMYGLAVLILISIFPFAAFYSLLPQKWSALLIWAKYFIWVKLWIVLWAILAKFSEWRDWDDVQQLEAQMGDTTLLWPGIVAMYLVVPSLALIVVQLLSAGARGISGSFGSMTPSGGASSFGMQGSYDASSGSGSAGGGGFRVSGGGGGGGGGAGAGAGEVPPVA